MTTVAAYFGAYFSSTPPKSLALSFPLRFPAPLFLPALPPSLSTIPPETIEHILKHAGADAAVAVEPLCRALRAAANSPSLWRHFYADRWSAPPPAPAPDGFLAPAGGSLFAPLASRWRVRFDARRAKCCRECEMEIPDFAAAFFRRGGDVGERIVCQICLDLAEAERAVVEGIRKWRERLLMEKLKAEREVEKAAERREIEMARQKRQRECWFMRERARAEEAERQRVLRQAEEEERVRWAEATEREARLRQEEEQTAREVVARGRAMARVARRESAAIVRGAREESVRRNAPQRGRQNPVPIRAGKANRARASEGRLR